MTSDTRTSDDIERDIAEERAQMSDTIHELQKKFSVDAIVSDIGSLFRGQGGDLGRAIGDTVGRNPAAVVMVGVGLAWLVLGRDNNHPTNASGHGAGRRNRMTHATGTNSTLSSDDLEGGPFRSDDRYWYGDGQMSTDYRSQGHGAKQRSARRPGAAVGANGMTAAIRNTARSVEEAVSDAAGSVGHAVADLKERLSHGLDDLSEEARARVVAARQTAHEARLASQSALNRGSRAASGFFSDQPLVVGALAVAIGAAIGGALPHSRIEDDTMGDSSDQLFAEAQAIYREERDKALAAVKMAGKDMKGELREVGEELADLLPEGKTLGESIVDRTADAAGRVIDRATGEAGHRKPDGLPT